MIKNIIKLIILIAVILTLATTLQACFSFGEQTYNPDVTDAEILEPDSKNEPDTLPPESEESIDRETVPELESEDVTAVTTAALTTGLNEETGETTSEEQTTEAETELPEITKYVAITFDDGPSVKNMSLILDKAEDAGIQVTFFMCGYKITEKSYPVLKRALELGCELGNHSTNHADFNKCTPEEIKAEIDTTNELIYNATGSMPTLMRPPYGNMQKDLGRNYDMSFILWSVDPEDWRYRDTQTVYDNVLNNVKDGDIILLHDTYTTSYEAFCLLVDELRARGYGLLSVSDLLSRSGSVEAGKYYYNTSVCK